MMKAMSGGGLGGLKNLFSGKTDMMSAMGSMSGGKKIKQRSKRKRVPRKKGRKKR
jgi:hypothetical protein